VTQSSFANPCHPLANGFFSTFIPTTVESNKTFTLLVNDTKPIWIYCAQTTLNHCQSGMVAAINAPATGNTLAAFTALAKNATTSTSPPDTVPLGGILAVKGTEEVKTVTASITTTITATVTAGGSTYATTYATSYGTTYTTDIIAQATNTGSSAGSGSGSGSSSTTSSSTARVTNGASGLAVNGGMAGAVLVAAWAML
jgi:hypothetical protein